jgi:hypothetical protein
MVVLGLECPITFDTIRSIRIMKGEDIFDAGKKASSPVLRRVYLIGPVRIRLQSSFH